ncbi:MAG: phage holin family protein [Armatimonadota bacterium]
MKLLLRWVLASVALLITVKLVPGMALTDRPWDVFLATALLALLNALALPFVILINLATLPLSCLTMGLWTLIVSLLVNIMIFQFVGSLGWGYKVDGFLPAAMGAIVMSVLTAVLSGLFHLGRKSGP